MSLPPGASGYLSPPSDHLDPDLFAGERLRPEVRASLVDEVFRAFREEGFKDPRRWLRVWLAGSGISYQWQADRGNGDLDVLVGVDYGEFLHGNPDYLGVGEAAESEAVNADFKRLVWPRLTTAQFGSSYYEVTIYWNPGTGTDIRSIHPYAAYDLLKDEWVVRPPKLPPDPSVLYPQDYFEAADADLQRATQIASRYGALRREFDAAPAQSPGRHNAGAALNLAVAQARAMFHDIHAGRREAFSPTGHGYGDWHNFRWQLAKKNGVIPALKQIIDQADADLQQQQTELYGAPIDPAADTLRRAELWNHGRVN